MAKGRKTRGHTKGTPNKENPLKGHLRSHSLAYFEPKPQLADDGTPCKIDFRDKEGNIESDEETKKQDNKGNPQGQ